MGTPFLGELRLMSFNYPPKGWAFCNGQQLPINQNQALFSLLGTVYGGNGQTTFALPNLRGRVAMHNGSHPIGQDLGEDYHIIVQNEMPQHNHFLTASNMPGDKAYPAIAGTPNLLASDPSGPYAAGFAPGTVALNAGSVTTVGGGQPHENRQPYLVLNWCIALQGIFPSQN